MDSNWIIVAVCTLTIWLTLVQGQPQYEVQVRGPIDFEYRSGQENRLADGRCCSLAEAGSECSISCDNQIILCFREVQHPTSDTSTVNCPLGRMIFSPPTMNTDIITFNATIEATTSTYPGSFQLLINIIALPGGNGVETGLSSPVQSIQDRDSQLTNFAFGLERILLQTGGIRVVCKEGYFGPDCGCTPQDDSTGHFTCDEDGTIVCLPGYQNTATNCVEEVITPELTTEPENSADIVLIVAGGVAGGLVVLLLMIIINIVLVIAAVKVKYRKKHHSHKQEPVNDEQIAMEGNPVYEIRNGNRPDDNNDSIYEIVE